jgi:predicted transcriptional regulator
MAVTSSRLEEELHRTNQELTAVAYEHAPSFVHAAEGLAVAGAALERASERAAAIKAGLASLRRGTAGLQEAGRGWRDERHLAAAAVSAQARLVELLDAPQTVAQCVRSGLLHEALLIVEHVASLHARGHNVELVARVHALVRRSLAEVIRTVLVPQLAGPLPPAQALRIVTFVRGLARIQAREDCESAAASPTSAGASDATASTPARTPSATAATAAVVAASNLRDLPEILLGLRAAHIQTLLRDNAALAGGSVYSLLQRTLATYKVQIPDAVATYSACFCADDAAAGDATSARGTPLTASAAAGGDPFDFLELPPSAPVAEARAARAHVQRILTTWCAVHGHALVGLFERGLSLLRSGADIAVLIEPTRQCSAALSRVGVDVGAALASALVRRVEALFCDGIVEARRAFDAALEAHRWGTVVDVGVGSTNNPEAPAVATPGDAAGGVAATGSSVDEQLVPPMVLLRFLPLAYACNACLGACQELRRCALDAAAPACITAVAALLAHMSARLADARALLALGDGAEIESLRRMAQCHTELCAPHIVRCVARVFNGRANAEVQYLEAETKRQSARLMEAVRAV